MLKKKVLSGLLAIALVFGSAAALPEGVFDTVPTITASAVSTATSGKCGENVKWKLTDGKLTISGTGEMTDYSNKNSPFCDRTDIQTVVIGSGVTSIGNRAFCNCSKLVNITIPDSVTRIGNSALKDCESLTDVTIPSGVISIDDYAFSGCKSLKSVTIPNSVKYLGTAAFINCESLTSVTIPSSVTYIYKSAFSNCKSLTSVTIPNSVSSIDEYAFAFCESLKSVTIPNSVKIINEGAFYECTNLESITIPDSVTRIGYNAFEGCENLTSVTLPNSIDSIYLKTFMCCYSLESVTLPDSITGIYNGAFYGCKKLKNINIPDSVEHIDTYAFKYCPNLTSLTIPSSVESIGNDAIDKECTIICEKGSKAEKYAKDNGLDYNYSDGDYLYKELDDGTVEITKYSGNYTILNIPSTLGGKQVTSIGSDAFSDRAYLEKIIIPSSVTNIAEKAFASAPGLKKITIPNSVKAIGNNAFNSKCTIICTKSSFAYVYAALYSIKCEYIAGDYIYKDIDDETVEITGYTGKDKTVNIPSTLAGKTVTSIGDSAFEEYISLTNVTIPSSVKSIGDGAFSNCRSLTNVTIPNSVTSIGEFAFCACGKLESAVIPTGVETITHDLFAECRGLKSVTIPSSVKSIGDGAFSNCSSLTSITIPGNVTYIGASAFEGCTGLKSLTIPSSVKTIDDYAFIGCGFTSLTVPKTVTKIGKEAIGYVYNELYSLVKDDNFTVKCYKGTAAEKYAKDNGFKIVYLGVTHVAAKAAACTADGNIEYWKYDGKFYSDANLTTEITQAKTVVKAGHKFSAWKTTAFDVAKGTSTQTRTCSACNKTESRTIENAIQRLAGAGRYETAAKISQASFTTADTVVLAYGLNYADALAGVSLATKMNAPILLTNTKTLDPTTLAEIKRLKAKNVIILGGIGAISAAVENSLKKEGLTTDRIFGASRFGTATAIGERLNEKPTDVFFVYAFNSADALSVSPIAACKNAPIIYLSTKGDLHPDTAAYLAKLKKAGSVKNAYVIGGEGVISNDMMNKAGNALGVAPTRVFGANRFSTCVAVNEKFANVLNGDMICVATGMDFPDALAGGVYAAINKAPLFLVNGKLKTPKLTDEQKAYLKSKAAAKITAFGGTGVVPDNHIADIAKNSI